jgi:hypothetical protein
MGADASRAVGRSRRDGERRAPADDNEPVTIRPNRTLRPWVAAAADLAVVVLFVLIGRRSHHEDAGLEGFFRVWWPFAVGLGVGWVVTGLARAPLAWGRAATAWCTTVAVGMALRIVVEGRSFSVAFTIVTLVFTGVGMLGWRAAIQRVRARRTADA